ncbi:MAG: hypothetical protein HZB61_01145 [Nitrospirae bacterium]|nr:hypothetical protein [Nitrospirota bacterium]
MTKKIILLLVLISALIACVKSEKETENIKHVIYKYNALLAEGYKNMNMNPMQEVATVDHATKLYYHMAALGESNIRMESQLKDIKFKEITFPERDKAVAATSEKWDYAHYDINTGEKKVEEKDFTYEMTYELKKEKDKWLVINVTAAGEEKSAQQ